MGSDFYAVAQGDVYGKLGHNLPGVLSDGTLVIVLRENSTNDWCLYTSVNTGETWTRAFTILANQASNPVAVFFAGDTIYVFKNALATTEAILLYRIGYSGGSFSLGLTGASAAPAVSGQSYNTFAAAKDPTGRLWLSAALLNPGVNWTIKVRYSDNDGSTWSVSIDADTSGGSARAGFFAVFQNNLVLGFLSNNGGSAFYTRQRLHTDGPTTWGAKSSRQALSGTQVAESTHGAPIAESPVKNFLFVYDQDTSPSKIFGTRIVETGSSLAFTNLSSISAPTGDTFCWAVASGRTDGWIVHYLFGDSLGTLRERQVATAAVAWPSEATRTIAAPIPNDRRYLAAVSALAGKAMASDEYLLAIRRDSGAPFTISALLLSKAVNRLATIALETASSPSHSPAIALESGGRVPERLASVALECRATLARPSLIPLESDATLSRPAMIALETILNPSLEESAVILHTRSILFPFSARIPHTRTIISSSPPLPSIRHSRTILAALRPIRHTRTIIPRSVMLQSGIAEEGIAQAGGAATITLALGSSTTSGFYIGMYITQGGETGRVTAYDGSTHIATVVPNWIVPPTIGTPYSLSAFKPGTSKVLHPTASVVEP
jgi:hypothetical protein